MGSKTGLKTGVRWLQLIVGVIALLFAGIIYAWSILKAPLAAEFGWSAAQLGLNFTITLAVFCVGGYLSGLISSKTTPMARLLIAAVLIFLSFFIVSILKGSIIILYLSYGLLGGLAIGFVYNTVLVVVMAWFPDKKGFASGFMLMGFGLNSILIGKLADVYINTPDIGWRSTFLAIAIITAVIFIIAAFIIKLPPEGMKFPAPRSALKKEQSDIETKDYTALEMIKRASFWKLFIFFIMLASVGSASISFAKDILKNVGGTDALAVTLVGIISIGSGIGRLISGWLFDLLGRRKMQFVMSAVAIISPLTVVLALSVNSLLIGIIGLTLCYITFGFAPTGSTAFINEFYGQKYFSLNLGILNLQLVLTAFASTLAGVIRDATGGFMWTYIILAGFSVAGLILNLFIKKP